MRREVIEQNNNNRKKKGEARLNSSIDDLQRQKGRKRRRRSEHYNEVKRKILQNSDMSNGRDQKTNRLEDALERAALWREKRRRGGLALNACMPYLVLFSLSPQ